MDLLVSAVGVAVQSLGLGAVWLRHRARVRRAREAERWRDLVAVASALPAGCRIVERRPDGSRLTVTVAGSAPPS